VARHSPFQLHSPVRLWAARVLISVVAVVGGYLVYEFGRIQAGYDLVDAAAERRGYEQHIVELEGEISALKEQVALLETHRDIDREAYSEVEASLTELQAKIQEQRDAIAFYRGIVSPADGSKGLRVQDLKLTRGRHEREYNIRLVLVQALKHDRKVTGNVNLTIEGDLDGEEKSYSYAELLPDEAEAAWAFSFRYFQDFNRLVVLPDGFTPQRVNVEVQSKTRSISSIEESFAWTTSQG
jgi:cell division protein FtsB